MRSLFESTGSSPFPDQVVQARFSVLFPPQRDFFSIVVGLSFSTSRLREGIAAFSHMKFFFGCDDFFGTGSWPCSQLRPESLKSARQGFRPGPFAFPAANQPSSERLPFPSSRAAMGPFFPFFRGRPRYKSPASEKFAFPCQRRLEHSCPFPSLVQPEWPLSWHSPAIAEDASPRR